MQLQQKDSLFPRSRRKHPSIITDMGNSVFTVTRSSVYLEQVGGAALQAAQHHLKGLICSARWFKGLLYSFSAGTLSTASLANSRLPQTITLIHFSWEETQNREQDLKGSC